MQFVHLEMTRFMLCIVLQCPDCVSVGRTWRGCTEETSTMCTTVRGTSGPPGQRWFAGWDTPASPQLTSALVRLLFEMLIEEIIDYPDCFKLYVQCSKFVRSCSLLCTLNIRWWQNSNGWQKHSHTGHRSSAMGTVLVVFFYGSKCIFLVTRGGDSSGF